MYTSGSIVSSGEDRVLFSWYSMRSMVVIRSSTHNALWPWCQPVGWWFGCQIQLGSEDRHCRVGTYCPLGWQTTSVFEDHLGVHLVQAEISLVRRYALHTYLGSAWSFHTFFKVLLAPRLGSMRLPQSLFSESGYGFPFHNDSDWYRQGRPMNHWHQ